MTCVPQAPPIELSVTVMTSTFWPMNHSAATCTFSPDMTKACKSFENFYLTRHSGRKLTWQPGLGNADVRVRFRSRIHDLNVSTYALVILLLFENVEENEVLSYEVCLSHPYAPPSSKVVRTANPIRNPTRRKRTQTQPPIPRLRKVQNPQETPRIARSLHNRYLLIQYRFPVEFAAGKD